MQIYLDYNATTPIDEEVAQTMRPFLDIYFGNPSSIHEYGVLAKKAVEKARTQVADLLNCNADEIVFTSGGTESNNYAIKGVAFQNQHKGNHIITSSIEHPAVIEVCKYLKIFGFEISYIEVDEFGMINPEMVEKAIKPQTILISIMHANNEVGTIQPISEIAKIAKKHNIIFHSDAAQSIGKIDCNVQSLGVDLLSVAGHKFYAPKGIGALYVKRGTKLQKQMHGADHEQNMRAGTENILEIAGLGKAAEIAKRNLAKNSSHLKEMRDLLYTEIAKTIEDIKLNGHEEKRLPNTLSLSFKNVEANTLLSELKEVAASAGAACHTDSIDVSAVLQAMKVPTEFAMGTIRFSTGKFSTEEEIKKAAIYICDAVKKLQNPLQKINISTDFSSIKLTQFTHGLGCACKMRPQDLEQVLKVIPKTFDPNVLVDISGSDDAAVYRIDNENAIVQTVDFFTPVVDNAYDFGAIAAANSISDIYAMGAKPLFALNIVAFPDKRLPLSVLEEILRGANDKAKEAEISILGGHTIEDNEPKFGMTVTGISRIDKILTNSGAKAGDAIILTKPIGTGIISTAVKRGIASKESERQAIATMSELNKKAAEVMQNFKINACTDVTGFGLLGHLSEAVKGSKLSAEIDFNSIPLLPEVYNLAVAGIIPGGTQNNLKHFGHFVNWSQHIAEVQKFIFADAQTSGGLLIFIADNEKFALLENLRKVGISNAQIIGKMIDNQKNEIIVF